VLVHRRDFTHVDVINSHFSVPTGPLACVVAKMLRRPHVLTIIGGDIYDPSKPSSPHRSALLRLINQWVINAADRVIAISSDTRRRAEYYYNIHRSIEVVNYGFTPFQPQGDAIDRGMVESSQFQLIAVGRLIRRKGFEYLIQAMKYLPEDVVLHLVGDGPLESTLKRLADRAQVSGRISMPGFQTREQIYRHLRQSDCFVLPSLHEGLGIVVQEAMEAGLPVVATNNGGQVDLITYPRNGILVEPANPLALAEAIRTLYIDRALARTMGRNNHADIQDLHIDMNCRLYLQRFEELSGLRRYSAEAPPPHSLRAR
jgi:glycosyltransferase involved in cell wall biosynthesis